MVPVQKEASSLAKYNIPWAISSEEATLPILIVYFLKSLPTETIPECIRPGSTVFTRILFFAYSPAGDFVN